MDHVQNKKRTTNLHSHDHRIQIQYGLPVLTQNVQAYVSLQIDIGMIDLLGAFDLGRVMWEVLIDRETEVEYTTLVHALVRFNSKSEVENVVRIGKGHFHCVSEGELLKV